MSNCLHGSKTLSSFELAKGYAPSLVGNPSRHIPAEFIDAHINRVAVRALNKLLRSRNNRLLTQCDIRTGDAIAYFYKSTKGTEKAEWREGKVTNAGRDIVEINTGKRGPNARIAYEDIRLMPKPTSTMHGDWIDGICAEGEKDDASITHQIGQVKHDRGEDFIQDAQRVSAHSPGETTKGLMADPSPPQQAEEREGYKKDVGEYEPSTENINGRRLLSQEAAILNDIKDKIGTGQVTASAIAFAPSWVVEKAMRSEHDENWVGAYEEVAESELPSEANVISSHVVFKIKTNDDSSLKLKGRIVVHGNRDADRDLVRSDCAAADMMLIRLVISLTTIMGFNLGSADIKGAYMQSGPIQREVYVRPPKDCYRRRGYVWRLLKLPYGMVDAGRQWLLRVEDWLLGSAGMNRVDGVNQIFTRTEGGRIKTIVAKVIDDFLVAGSTEDIKGFFKELSGEFQVGKTAIGGLFRFNGCEIDVGRDAVELSMWDYIEKLSPVELTRERRRQKGEKATASEETAYRALAGTLMYMGNSVTPQASFITSRMQQELGDLRVGHIIEGNNRTKEMVNLRPYIRYIRPSGMSDMRIVSLSDAAHGGSSSIYGQTGGICGILIEACGVTDRIFHPISWTSHKQKRVSYSAFGAEILAAADADDRGFYLKMSLKSMMPRRNLKHELFVDARALFDTITTLHEPREYRLRKTVARMRDAYESGELDYVTWIDGRSNLADALTKVSPEVSIRLNNMLACGIWDVRLDDKWRL